MIDRVGQQFGNYRLLRLLGQGAFAVVYLGEHQYLERPAAIKILHMQMEPKTHEAFRHEARTIARLQHPHIVQVHDFGIEGQTPYLVMEYTPNGTLQSLYPKGTRLSLEQIITYVKQIASALDYAHQQRVIHRDIKPANLLLNARSEVVLSDFGLAVVERTLESLSEQNAAGTPLYMAPEQILHHPCPASDQYALGVMVYEWLCGEPPFPGPGIAVFGQHLHQAPPSLRARLPHLPPAVEDAVFGALAKNPEQRFATVQDFTTALEEACFATQPLSIRRSTENTPQALEDPTQPLSAVRALHAPPAVQPASPLAQRHQSSPPVSVMCVCAPEDRALLEQWEAHLRPLVQTAMLSVWSEHHLLPGSPRQQQIEAHLDQAELIVLLVSADFFASDDCMALMRRALHRQQHNGGVDVVPLLLRPVEWRASPLALLSCVPSNHLPVTAWTNRDAAFDWCVRDLRRLLGHPMPPQRAQQALVPSSTAKRNRQILLRKVRSFWIEGVLNHSLHGAALMTLGLETQPDAIANPWHLVLQHPDTSPRPLPTGTRIKEVYDDAEGELLILGAPGSGKTTLLLELARDLLARAEGDEQHPMPVVFSLSSWAMKQQTLIVWLVEELSTKYQVPAKLGQALVEADQILPLLDGLDEVAPTARTTCIEAINTYRQEHGLLPLVVCSRQADYLAQSGRLLVRSAVTVQPLTQEQVDAYLAQGGEPLWALRVALHQDAVLCELTSTPLMLSILTLTYHGKPVEELLRGTSMEERQRQIFEQYVQRMLTRRGPLKTGTAQQVVQWLTFLATRMREHNQTVFYLEQMQPDWLPENRLRRFHRVGVELLSGLIGVLLFGLVFGLFGGYVAVSGDPAEFVSWLRSGLGLGLFFGSAGWWVYLTSSAWAATKLADFLDRSWWNIRLYSARFLLDGLVVGLLGGLGLGLAVGQALGLEFGLYYGLGYLLCSILSSVDNRQSRLSRLIRQRWTEIKPVEVVIWSWVSMRWNFWKGLTLPMIFGLFFGLGYTWASGDLGGALISSLLAGLAGAVPIGLASGWSREMLSEHHRLTPNQGIWLSARNGVLAGLANGLCLGLIFGLIAGLFGDLVSALVVGLTTGVGVGLIFGLSSGGMAYMQHVVLRLLLQRAEVIPRHYVRFLDEAASCILLQKVGGGYSFVHRLLLDYFAALEQHDRL